VLLPPVHGEDLHFGERYGLRNDAKDFAGEPETIQRLLQFAIESEVDRLAICAGRGSGWRFFPAEDLCHVRRRPAPREGQNRRRLGTKMRTGAGKRSGTTRKEGNGQSRPVSREPPEVSTPDREE
jgi:hypothetical protein